MRLRILIWLNKLGLIDKWRCYLCYGRLKHLPLIVMSYCVNTRCDGFNNPAIHPLEDRPMQAIDLITVDKVLKGEDHD